jgi:hypothetical protein
MYSCRSVPQIPTWEGAIWVGRVRFTHMVLTGRKEASYLDLSLSWLRFVHTLNTDILLAVISCCAHDDVGVVVPDELWLVWPCCCPALCPWAARMRSWRRFWRSLRTTLSKKITG